MRAGQQPSKSNETGPTAGLLKRITERAFKKGEYAI
jgi:hypothetical protein